MAEARGRFLYEVRPDLFPTPWLTDAELRLWGRFYEDREERREKHSG